MKSLSELQQFYVIQRSYITRRFLNKTRIKYKERINSKRLRIAREEATKDLDESVIFLKLYVNDIYKQIVNNRNSTSNFPDGYGV